MSQYLDMTILPSVETPLKSLRPPSSSIYLSLLKCSPISLGRIRYELQRHPIRVLARLSIISLFLIQCKRDDMKQLLIIVILGCCSQKLDLLLAHTVS